MLRRARDTEGPYGTMCDSAVAESMGRRIQAMFVTNTYPGGYWEDQGYNWFGGS